MNWYPLLKFLHILAVIMFTGGMFARQLVRTFAKQASSVESFASLSRAAGIIDMIMVRTGSSAALVLGIILALMAGFPILGFLQGASENWLLVSNLLLAGVIAIIPTVLLPRGKKFEPILQTALARGEITPELRTAMEDRAVKVAHLYEEIAIILITALMVLKPF